mmetsp:Transcript_8134/g.27036  ORF Transcript_8134/g.27036 Transcript_8134/m.27036 type:complete len:162 (-) Transcript_8134:49-534(-)
MPVHTLCVSLEHENVQSFIVPQGHSFCLDVKQSDGDEERKGVWVSVNEENELQGSRGTANFIIRFPDANKQSSLNVVEIPKVTRPWTADDGSKMVPVIAFDCRGLEPTAWYPESGYTIESTSGTKFEDVDLSDEWCDYDEKLKESLSISKVNYEFKTHRGS